MQLIYYLCLAPINLMPPPANIESSPVWDIYGRINEVRILQRATSTDKATSIRVFDLFYVCILKIIKSGKWLKLYGIALITAKYANLIDYTGNFHKTGDDSIFALRLKLLSDAPQPPVSHRSSFSTRHFVADFQQLT